jgi:protocatechuate 3,4-dioxygenase beta subunit
VSNVPGPFYLPDAPWIANPGSVIRQSSGDGAVELTGLVTDAAAGTELGGAVVDVWQADAEGRYSNEDMGDGDRWHLRGRQRTDAAGRYTIETILPRHYTIKDDGPVGRLLVALGRHPWRPAHIHLRVTADGYRPLVTQIYIAGSPYLDDDAISAVRETLVRAPVEGRITFDVALGG